MPRAFQPTTTIFLTYKNYGEDAGRELSFVQKKNLEVFIATSSAPQVWEIIEIRDIFLHLDDKMDEGHGIYTHVHTCICMNVNGKCEFLKLRLDIDNIFKHNNEHEWEDLYGHLKDKSLFALASYKLGILTTTMLLQMTISIRDNC